MASGSSVAGGNLSSKGFDFGSDEDYCNRDKNDGARSDSLIGLNSSKEFSKSRIARTSMLTTTAYRPPEESSFNHDVMLTVEKTMKKHSEDLMRFLEGISSRLSQLELYCFHLDKSIGEMRSDLVCDHDESESKLISLEKHIQEVHKSVQILRDKQELAESQKGLAKLQLSQKEFSPNSNVVQNEEKVSLTASEEKESETPSNVRGEQLTLVPLQAANQSALASQPVEYQQPSMAPPSSMPSQTISLAHACYLPLQMTNQPVPLRQPQSQCLPAQLKHQDLSSMDLQPIQSQPQDFSRIIPQQTQFQGNQNPQFLSLPPYRQQWPLQEQHVQPSQQPIMQSRINSSTPTVYPLYLSKESNQTSAEMTPGSMPMHVSFAGASQTGSVASETIPYRYEAAGKPIQPQPSPQKFMTGVVVQSGDRHEPGGPRPAHLLGNAYMIYDADGGRTHHPPSVPHYQQGGSQSHFQHGASQSHFQHAAYYPPTSISQNPQHMPGSSMIVPQSPRSHPYTELIEKLLTMGYRGDHVVGVIQRMEENGQHIDFDAVLHRLNSHTSGGSQRGWSG